MRTSSTFLKDPCRYVSLYIKKKSKREALINYDGIVITHGQIRWKKTAYFLIPWSYQRSLWSLWAMRSSNELGSDGVYTFSTAFHGQADPKARDKALSRHERMKFMRLSTSPKPIPPMSAPFPDTNPRSSWVGCEKETPSLKQLSQWVRFDLDKIEGSFPLSLLMLVWKLIC